jgi:hypothetical protein
MTSEEKLAFDAINARLEYLEHHQRFDEADALIAKERWILNYDSKGNFVGAVANENGWAA